MQQTSSPQRYRVAASLRQLYAALDIAPGPMLDRAGLPRDALDTDDRGLTAAQYCDLLHAFADLHFRPDLPQRIAELVRTGGFNPSYFAFSCSPTVAVGLKRLGHFKPLAGPFRLDAEHRPEGFRIALGLIDSTLSVPMGFRATEIAMMLDMIRTGTGQHIVPLAVGAPDAATLVPIVGQLAGCDLHEAAEVELLLRPEDANRRLISENAALWDGFAPGLQRALDQAMRPETTQARVRDALLELLPAGHAGAAFVSRNLNLSQRSLYRRLQDEGQTFQGVLDETRRDLALHYLQNDAISTAEIAHLLGYRDPNSFYRAFRGWTGRTPKEQRQQGLA